MARLPDDREGMGYRAMEKPRTGQWMAAAMLVALAMVLVIRMTARPADQLSLALRSTARWSFLWFWLSYTGGALATLFGSPFERLARRGRDFGLAFASAHLVHVGLVAWLLLRSPTPFPRSPLIFFGIGVFWIYLLALLSVRPLSGKLRPGTERMLRTVGVEYIAFAFLVDFAKNPFGAGISHLAAYLPFLVLAAGGPLLRLAATAKSLGRAPRLAV